MVYILVVVEMCIHYSSNGQGRRQVDRSVQVFFFLYSLYIVIPLYTSGPPECRIVYVMDTF